MRGKTPLGQENESYWNLGHWGWIDGHKKGRKSLREVGRENYF